LVLDVSVTLTLARTLTVPQVTSNEISVKVAEAEATEKTIDATREEYRPVATRASVLFFCISDLAAVDPMYQYSLAWFITLFLRAIAEADKAEEVAARLVRSRVPSLWGVGTPFSPVYPLARGISSLCTNRLTPVGPTELVGTMGPIGRQRKFL
jgi:hypothetical protein